MDQERSGQIINILKEEKTIGVDDLAYRLYVSKSTMRRDLSKLESKGLISREFGNISIVDGGDRTETAFALRRKENVGQKRALAKAAVEYINDGDVVFIDASTTALQIVEFLNERKNLTVLTNGIVLANELSMKTQHDIVFAGGKLQPLSESCLDRHAERIIRGYHANAFIMSASALDKDFGLSESSEEHSEIKKAMIEQSEKTIALIEKEKIGKCSLARTCLLPELYALITDIQLSDEYLAKAPNTIFKVV